MGRSNHASTEESNLSRSISHRKGTAEFAIREVPRTRRVTAPTGERSPLPLRSGILRNCGEIQEYRGFVSYKSLILNIHGGERWIRTPDGAFDPTTAKPPALIELSKDCLPDAAVCFRSASAIGQSDCSFVHPQVTDYKYLKISFRCS